MAVEAFREGFLRCVGAVFMMGNDKVEASAKVTWGGTESIYDDGEGAQEKTRPGESWKQPTSSDRRTH